MAFEKVVFAHNLSLRFIFTHKSQRGDENNETRNFCRNFPRFFRHTEEKGRVPFPLINGRFYDFDFEEKDNSLQWSFMRSYCGRTNSP